VSKEKKLSIMRKQDCWLCFYKYAASAKNTPSFCMSHIKRVENCTDFKNNILINSEQYHFINPLNESSLDEK
jgi:hypothetical protein